MPVELYFSPLACSMATRIALYEAGAPATFIQVDLKAKRLPDGQDFRALNPLGQVPVLRTDEGDLLTENQVILQHVAECHAEAGLAPASGIERYRLLQWLGFVSTELHKAVYTPLLDPTAPEGAKAYARAKAGERFDHLDRHLAGRETLLNRFSVADAYLFTVLGWTIATDLDLAAWPNVQAYAKRLRERPSVAKALSEERRLYAEEQARRQAA